MNEANSNMIDGALYETYLNCHAMCSDEAKKQKETMHFNLKSNAFVKYRDT